MAGRITTAAALTLMLALGSCSAINPLSLLTGGGPNVAANGQIGAENNQGINTSVDRSVRPEVTAEGPVETVDQSTTTTNNTEIDPLMLILLVLGWLAPSPNEIGRGIYRLLSRKKE